MLRIPDFAIVVLRAGVFAPCINFIEDFLIAVFVFRGINIFNGAVIEVEHFASVAKCETGFKLMEAHVEWQMQDRIRGIYSGP